MTTRHTQPNRMVSVDTALAWGTLQCIGFLSRLVPLTWRFFLITSRAPDHTRVRSKKLFGVDPVV